MGDPAESIGSLVRRILMREEMPRSITSVARVVLLMLGIGGGLTLIEMMVLAGHEAWLALLFLGPPIATCTFVGHAFTEQRFGRGGVYALVGFFGHFVVGLITATAIEPNSSSLPAGVLGIAAVLLTLVAVVALPVLIGGSVIGLRKDLEAGDAMLGFSAAWLVALQTFALWIFGSSFNPNEPAPQLIALMGMVFGLGAFGVFVGRAIARRAWSKRVLRGELNGWRIRDASADELVLLPPLYGSVNHSSAVLERVEVRGMLYRSGVVGEPLATMRVRP